MTFLGYLPFRSASVPEFLTLKRCVHLFETQFFNKFEFYLLNRAGETV